MDDLLIYEKSSAGRKAYSLPKLDVPVVSGLIPEKFLRKEKAVLPEVSEPDVIRHYTRLSQKNYGVDTGFYPLGSCTMKYNPKINEDMASLPGFLKAHPASEAQGCLQIIKELSDILCEVSGMDDFSLAPAAGSHGELAGLYIIKAYHNHRNDEKRTKILIPDSAHGTNPASAVMAGFETVSIKSDEHGNVDINDLKVKTDETTAGLMLTNPSTLGLFEPNISEIAEIVHGKGGLLYYDGANLNAIMGITRPGDMGFDVMHINLHKTFSSPHGGGGAGSGPVGVKAFLADFLPVPRVEQQDGVYKAVYNKPLTIGKVRSFFGNFSVLVRSYAYALTMGADGLKAASENAVLNANYLMKKMSEFMDIAYERTCMHEFVATAVKQKEQGASALDIAKRMLDFGVHPPTVYFPLIVKEAMMFEPSETESKQTLDGFVEIMRMICSEAEHNPEVLKSAPHDTCIGRLDDVGAARNPVLRWKK
jgi:glycine dehydrogenase subunit 2